MALQASDLSTLNLQSGDSFARYTPLLVHTQEVEAGRLETLLIFSVQKFELQFSILSFAQISDCKKGFECLSEVRCLRRESFQMEGFYMFQTVIRVELTLGDRIILVEYNFFSANI